MTRVFIDTNVLCYVHDPSMPTQRARAEDLIVSLAQPHYVPVISTQVLQEFYNTLTRKFRIAPAAAKQELLLLHHIETLPTTPPIILAAADLHASASLSFWDALIIAAAQFAQCDELWSEDLQTHRIFGKLKIINPF